MIVVVLHTFRWAKVPMVISALLPESWRPKINRYLACNCYPGWLRLHEQVDRWECIIILVVSILTVAINLVVGVGVGLFLAAVRFSWTSSAEASVQVVDSAAASKRYRLDGKLFFGTSMRFHTLFDVENDPAAVTLELAQPPADYSAHDAIDRISALYAAQKKTLTIEVAGKPVRTNEVRLEKPADETTSTTKDEVIA